jgi:hypothetical protein
MRYNPDGTANPAPGQTGATFIPAQPGLQFIDGMVVDRANTGNVIVTSERISASGMSSIQEYSGVDGSIVNQAFIPDRSGGINLPGGLLIYDDGTGPGHAPKPPAPHGSHTPHGTDATLESASQMLGQFQQVPGSTFNDTLSTNNAGQTSTTQSSVVDTTTGRAVNDHAGSHNLTSDLSGQHSDPLTQQDAAVQDAVFSTL